MKAWRIEQHGGPEVAQWKDVPAPVAGPGEALVKVQAVGLNHMDLWVRKGVPGHQFPLPLTPGCDVAGKIEAFGPLSKEASQKLVSRGLVGGANVLVNPVVSCELCEACLSGNPQICDQFGLVGETRDGGAAEYIVVPVRNLVLNPLSATDAVCLPINAMTAWGMLTRKAQLRPGEFVLIQAGGSGVGVAAIQFAKMLGATVITTVGSDDKIAKAQKLGADHVINYRKGPFRDELKKILSAHGRRGVDVAVDHVGKDTINDSLRSLVWGGRLTTCGATSGSEISLDLKAVFFKSLSILGSTMGSMADLNRIVGLTKQGKYKPVIDSTFSFADYPKAVARLESRAVFGKVVLKA